MDPGVRVVRLGPADAVRYVFLRQRLMAYDWQRAGSLHGMESLTPASVRGMLADDKCATFAVEASDEPYANLAAIATVMRTTHIRRAHRALLVHVFTDERHRGRGLGEAVVSAAVDCARVWPGVDFVDLCVSEDAEAAQRLYERLGFVTWGHQPEATDYHGRRVGDIHMSLRLNSAHR